MKKLIATKHFYFKKGVSKIFLSKYLDNIITKNLKPSDAHYKLCKISTWNVFVCNHIQVTSDNNIFIPGSCSFVTKQGLDSNDLAVLKSKKCKKKVILIIKFVLQQVLEGKYARY